ncbi:MAG TPA: HlyD family secretion protein [Gemmatimonadaceae bacterium]|nr:HlyD family secretion protein [Gemmatimonadaceae bacterium]
MANRKRILPIIGVLLLLGLAWFGRQWWYNRTHESTDNAQIDGHLVPVLAKVGGYVRRVGVAENDSVKSGQLLIEIDDAEYRVRLAQAAAELQAALATSGGTGVAGQAQAQVSAAAGQRAALESQTAAARAARDKAAADLGRMKDLAAKQIVSSQQLDAAQAAYDGAEANLRALGEQAGAATATVTSAQAGVRLAQARLASAQAARDNAALQLEYTKVTAPAAGTVARKQVEVGQLVQPGQPLLTVVADTGTFVTANFKETQLVDLAVGQKVDVHVDAYDCHAEGRVESVSAATGAKFALLPPDNATGNFTKVVQRVPVRIAVTKACEGNRPLRPGLSVTVHVETKS